MFIEVGGHYKLINDANKGTEEYLRAGTEVIVEEIDTRSHVFVRENSDKNNFIKTYVRKDNLKKLLKPNKRKQSKIVKSPTVSQSDLIFLKEATEQLHKNSEWYTYRNDENSYIALRMENSINIFRIEPVANFEGVLNK